MEEPLYEVLNLITALNRVGADDQVAVLAKRAAAAGPADFTLSCARLRRMSKLDYLCDLAIHVPGEVGSPPAQAIRRASGDVAIVDGVHSGTGRGSQPGSFHMGMTLTDPGVSCGARASWTGRGY
jgi:hypothetical protein